MKRAESPPNGDLLMSELPDFMTRRQLVKHINEKLGIPLTKSTFDKKAMRKETPPPDAYYGRIELYSPKRGEDWARETLCTAAPANLGTDNPAKSGAA
jgi:hypothetical protein